MKIEISKLQINPDIEDLNKIAFLHQKYLAIGLLSKFGKIFLKILYEDIVSSKDSFLVIARDPKSKEIIGFCSGTYNTKVFYKRFFRKNFFRLLLLFFNGLEENRAKILLSSMRVFFSEIIRFIFKAQKNEGPKKICLAQLLSLVVEESYQNAGVGHLLFMEFSNTMECKGIFEFFTIAAYSQEKAQLFYSRQGGIKTEELKLDQLESAKYHFKIKPTEFSKYGS